MKIIKFNGNDKCFSALVQDDEKEEYFFLFGKTKEIYLNIESEDSIIIVKKIATLNIKFLEDNGKLFMITKLKNKESYEDMRFLWESINE